MSRDGSIATTLTIAAVGVGALYVIVHRRRLFRRFTDPLHNQSVQIVTNAEDCRQAIELLREHCREFPVLGFDCEWVREKGKQVKPHPVALLQLASHRGLCVLIRLFLMEEIPQELRDLLSDPTIVKVGIDAIEDSKLLVADYDLRVQSTLDLRHMAGKCDNLSGLDGLAKLAHALLGVKMDKDWRISASNWEKEELTERQIRYAASDAHVAVELFRTLARKIVPRPLFTSHETWLTNTLLEFECFYDQKYRRPKTKNKPSKKSKH